MESLKTQPGGDHYRKMKIQPIEYIVANGIDFLAGNIIKYASRHSSKGGAADIRKIKHYCDLILEFVYGESPAGDAPSDPVEYRFPNGGVLVDHNGRARHPADASGCVPPPPQAHMWHVSSVPWVPPLHHNGDLTEDAINSASPTLQPSDICQGCGRAGGHHRPECKTQEHNDGRSDG